MCADHHKLIDVPTTGPRDYPVERLKAMKKAHEEKVEKVCKLFNVPKTIVGDRLREHKTYANMLEPEGKRCWTLNYDEFHMDILPCVPNNRFYAEPLPIL